MSVAHLIEKAAVREKHVVKDALRKCPVLVQNIPHVISDSNAD